MTTISVCNWERFQHYKDRDPPWIKLYRDLLTSESWVMGTDTSRLVQIAITLLAARYQNAVPFNFGLIRKVASLDCSESQFKKSVEHLVDTKFLVIQQVTIDSDGVAQSASSALATCTSETEQSREDTEKIQNLDVPLRRGTNGHEVQSLKPEPVAQVFEHWRVIHAHPKSVLDDKRQRLIRAALKLYPPESLCEAISGYLKSPWHMGDNPAKKKYDDIEIMLRDAKQIDAGLALKEKPQVRQWE